MNKLPVDLPGTASASARWELGPVIDALRISRETTHNIRHHGRVRELPSREALMQVISGVSAALFPTHYGRPDLNDESIDFFVGDTLNVTLDRLAEQVRRGLRFTPEFGPGRARNAIHQYHAVAQVQGLIGQAARRRVTICYQLFP